MHTYKRAKRIARPKKPPRTAPRMVFNCGSEPLETAGTAASVGVWVVAAGFVTLAKTDDVEDDSLVDVDVVDVAVAEEEVVDDSVERILTWESFEPASSQLFSLALNMHKTSSSVLPPAMTTMPSGPCAKAKLFLVTLGAKVELYAGQSLSVNGSLALLSTLLGSCCLLLVIRLRTGAAFGTGAPGPVNKIVRLTAFGDTDMSNVTRFFDPSSPVSTTAWMADVSFGSGAASDAPESTHLLSAALNSITCVFHVLPPSKTASPADHGSKIGLRDGGAFVSWDAIAYGADAPIVKVWVDGPFEPSGLPA